MKVLIERAKWPHVYHRSGYDIVFENLDHKIFSSVLYSYRFGYLKNRMHDFFKIVMPKFFNNDYRFPHFVHELTIAFAILKHKPTVVHITHAHSQFKIINRKYFLSRTRFVGTLHLPFVMWKVGKQKMQWLDLFDTIMVLDYGSYDWFTKQTQKKIAFTPHPVDVHHFLPTKTFQATTPKEAFTCYFVGRLYRNVDMVLDIIQKLYDADKSIQFYFSHPLIHSPQHFFVKMISVLSLPTVTYYNKVANEEYLGFFQKMDVLVMPMGESTANNVFLESTACGTPVLTTRTNGTLTYTPPALHNTIGNLHTADDIVAEVLKMRNDPAYHNNIAKEMCNYTRENFTVEKALEVPMKIYEGKL